MWNTRALVVVRDNQRLKVQDAYQRAGVAGSGVIASGLAACATQAAEVMVLARSEASAARVAEAAHQQADKLEGGVPERITVTLEASDLAECGIVVEAITEDPEAKGCLLADLASACPEADLATTTSSLSITDLAERSGAPDRVLGLHVFNPVTRMKLIEVCAGPRLRSGARERALAWCEAMGKTVVEVPDQPGFVVNRLLFPFLFEAVRLMEQTEMSAEAVDCCMTLGAGHPMGPLRLLDFVGLDVCVAIGESLHEDSDRESDLVPALLREHVAAGRLGRKAGAGFYDY